MTSAPSPPARRMARPRWWDVRFVAGLLLVLVSVVVGTKLVAQADDSVAVWTARADLAAGTSLRREDLVVRKARFFGNGDRYLPASADPVGTVLVRALGHDEFVARDALRPAGAGEYRLVVVPVSRHHAPPGLAHGASVDLYVTPRASGGGAAPAPQLVLAGAIVQAVDAASARFGAGGADFGVVLAVPPPEVPRVVAALGRGAVDLVQVPA